MKRYARASARPRGATNTLFSGFYKLSGVDGRIRGHDGEKVLGSRPNPTSSPRMRGSTPGSLRLLVQKFRGGAAWVPAVAGMTGGACAGRGSTNVTIPSEAEFHAVKFAPRCRGFSGGAAWIPAFAGMTGPVLGSRSKPMSAPRMRGARWGRAHRLAVNSTKCYMSF